MDFDGFCSLIMDNCGNYKHENPILKKKKRHMDNQVQK